mgnify:CR=1 FL=1
MIAEIQPSFASHTALSRKVEYHLGKIDEGNARVLYTSTGSDLFSFPGDMRLVSQLNDRVKLPYSEITLSLYPGENLTDEQCWRFLRSTSARWGMSMPAMPSSSIRTRRIRMSTS